MVASFHTHPGKSAEAAGPGRVPLHTRNISYRVFARPDGLWEVEGSLMDTKEFAFDRPHLARLEPGDKVHHMRVAVTVGDSLRIVAIEAHMDTVPLGDCQHARGPLRKLIGAQLGRGWRRSLDAAMGGTAGCTHLRELLYNLATAAIQGIPGYRDQQRRERGLPSPHDDDAMPHFVDGCMTWRRNGPAVHRMMPRYAIHPLIERLPE